MTALPRTLARLARLVRRRWAAPRVRRLGMASAGVIAASGALVVGWPRPSDQPPTSAVVAEAPFVHALVERGTVSASRMLLYASTIAGVQAKLIDIVAEGTAVRTGDVLFRLDPVPFEEQVARETAVVAAAEAELLRAREDLRLEEMKTASDADAAQEQLSAAEAGLVSERDGRGPLALVEAEVAANDAARERRLAETTVGDMRALLQQGFVTRVELERAEEALRQADDRQRLATLKLETLRTYDRPAALDRSRAGVSSARKGVESAAEAGRARLMQRRADVALAVNRLAEAQQRLRVASDRLSRTTVRSTSDGLVVYRELFFGSDKRKPLPGDEVWPSQPLVAVPDSSQLIVETRVREIDLHKVSSSQRVTVTVDAYPGVVLPARVVTVGALAQDDPARAGTRFFPVTVQLLGTDARLRTGMSARVSIEVAAFDRVTVVPLSAIVDDGGVTRVTVVTPFGRESRVVDVLAENDQVAAIRQGVTAGDTVLLVDPARPAGSLP